MDQTGQHRVTVSSPESNHIQTRNDMWSYRLSVQNVRHYLNINRAKHIHITH